MFRRPSRERCLAVVAVAAVALSGSIASAHAAPAQATSGYPPSSPAVATSGGNWEVAYVGGNVLFTGQQSGTVQVHDLGVADQTSPAIAAVTGGYQIAFQSSDGRLWTTGPYGTKSLGLRMMAGTSPSITAVPGGYQIAFQANTGMLWTTGKHGTHNLGLGMSKYGSPSIAAVTGGYVIAFKANTGKAWLAGTQGHRSLGVQMSTYASNENPAIAAHGKSWEMAFMDITNEIWTATSTRQGDTGQESEDLTSPAISWQAHEGWVTSFNTDTNPGHVVVGHGSDFVVDTTTDVAPNTSIALSASVYGFVTAYVSSAVPAVVVNGQYFGVS